MRVCASSMFRPAYSATAWAAAVSHSMVGPKRGYMSAVPSATRHILSEDPQDRVVRSGCCCRRFWMYCWVCVSMCEREHTTV